ncbi:MAG: vanadium-dependent haloperoxidase [Acidobacteriota bacterium]
MKDISISIQSEQNNQDKETGIKTSANQSPNLPSRRKFLGNVGSITAATMAASVIGLQPFLGSKDATADAKAVDPLTSDERRKKAFVIRQEVAQANFNNTPPDLFHPTNGDEELYATTQIGSYSKGLPHQLNGEVVLSAYKALVTALATGTQDAFNAIPSGAPPNQRRRFVNPQSALVFEIEGPDSHSLVQAPPPTFASAEEAAEIAENYWMALARDVHFASYGNDPITAAAIADLNKYSQFKGPKIDNKVTARTLFRGLTKGDLKGPYLSQYFYLPCFFGANQINQQIRTVLSPHNGGADYMTTFSDWLEVQNGFVQPPDKFDPVPRYMRNGRDIGQWVHVDVLFQAYFQAFLVLSSLDGGSGVLLDNGNPYKFSANQDGFGTFGGPFIASLLCEVARQALHAVWYQKWSVHRRLRPEVFGGRIERVLKFNANYPVNTEILTSLTTASRLGAYFPNPSTGTFLVPMAFPEGSPLHPAYGAGHATVAGACVTILKAWFDESQLLVNYLPNVGFSNLVQASKDGLSLIPYTGSDANTITIGDELNKIASNVAIGRNIAGVHWRSDATTSLLLGEEIAIRVLKELRPTFNEKFGGFSLTKFDGNTIIV